MDQSEALKHLTAELAKLNKILTGDVKVTPDAWTEETLAAHYHISLRAAARIIRKHGVRIDREWRLPEWKRRKLEEAGPHYLGTFK